MLAVLAMSAFSASAQVLTFDQAKQRADQGDAFAQAVVALHYQLGWNTEKDPELAARYATASAKAGHPLGKFRLGALLRAGEGVPKDEQQGLALQAASFDGLDRMTGDPYALTSLGVMIFQGKAVWQDVPQEKRRKQAAQLYKRAADAGFAPAIFNYAMCLDAGHGVAEDKSAASQLVTRVQELQYPPALAQAREVVTVEESISEDIAGAVLNPETFVWEARSNTGSSSKWHGLVGAKSSADISADVRANYHGFPAAVNAGSDSFAHTKSLRQSLLNSWQHVVTDGDEDSLTVAMPVPAESKNVLSITEYPIALEFRLTNAGGASRELKELRLEMEDSEQVNRMIPVVAQSHQGVLRAHNLGWQPLAALDAQLTLCLPPDLHYTFNHSEEGKPPKVSVTGNPSKRVVVGKAGVRFTSEAEHKASLPELLGVDSQSYSGLEQGQGVPCLENSCVLVADITATDQSDQKLNFSHIMALDCGQLGAQKSIWHNRLVSDLVLPADRRNYSISYPARLSIQPKTEARFRINFTTDRSAKVTLKPVFVFEDGTEVSEKRIVVHSDVARPIEGQQLGAVIAEQASDYLGYELAKESGNYAPLADAKNEDFEQEMKRAEGILRAAKAKNASTVTLKPAIQTSPAPSIFTRLLDPSSPRWPIGGWHAKIAASGSNGLTTGVLEVRDTRSDAVLCQIPWAHSSADKEFSWQCAGSKEAGWLAWLLRSQGTTKLFVGFPGRSDCAWYIPDAEEQKVEAISSSKDGMKLLLRTADGFKEVDMSGGQVEAAIRALNLAGIDPSAVRPYEDEVDDLARVRLSLPIRAASEQFTATEPKMFSSSEEPPENGTRLAWLDKLKFAVQVNNAWLVWDLSTGTTSSASEDDIKKSEQLVRKTEAECDVPENLQRELSQPKQAGCWSLWDGWATEIGLGDGRKISVKADSGGEWSPPRNILLVTEYTADRSGGWFPRRSCSVVFGNHAMSHAPRFGGAKTLAVSPDQKFVAFLDRVGRLISIVDTEQMEIFGRAFLADNASETLSVVTSDGFYLSGNGECAGAFLNDAINAFPIARFEAKYNRPDLVLERLGADESLIKEARRLRERLVRRSDFKSFDGAALIDIPVVTVKSEVPEQTGEKSLSLDFEASNSTGPLKELRVFNNGALVQTLELTGKDGQPSREASGDVEIDLASGENRLQLMAVSEEGFTSAFAEKRVECTAEPDSRRCFIATVGVSEYNDPRFNLKFAAKDAEDMSKALAEKALHRGYQPEVMVVRNAEVDGTLVEKLREFLAQAGTDDEVVLFFAGHGLLDKDLEYHFARHDTDFDASENMGITFQELESLVDGIKPLKRTVLFDTCHSGEVEEEDKPQLLAMVGSGDLGAAAAADTGVQVRGVATRGMKVKELEPKLRHTDFVELESLFPDSRRAKGANILTSSSGSEFSMESDAWKNGLFTYAFLNALNDEKTDADGDKAVSFSEAAAAVQDKVKTLSGGYQRPITRGVNREAEVALASFGPPVAPIPTKENKSGWWPF